MFSIFELDRINLYLGYLANGIENNGLSQEQYKEVMDLSCRCLDEADEIESLGTKFIL